MSEIKLTGRLSVCVWRVTSRLKKKSGKCGDEDHEELSKQFDVQSGRGLSADHQRTGSTVSVSVASQQPGLQKRSGSGLGASFGVGHDGPQPATPRDEKNGASIEWALITSVTLMDIRIMSASGGGRGQIYLYISSFTDFFYSIIIPLSQDHFRHYKVKLCFRDSCHRFHCSFV